MTELFEVHCNRCNGSFILDQEPVDWVCICMNKPKPWSILNHCSNGHTTWLKNMSGSCDECQKQKTIKIAKKLLEFQNNPKRQEMENYIDKSTRKSREKQEEYFKRKILIDDSIIDTPVLLKELIETVNSLKKNNENSKKLDDLDSKLKELESKLVQ